jgi:hypothetical protein
MVCWSHGKLIGRLTPEQLLPAIARVKGSVRDARIEHQPNKNMLGLYSILWVGRSYLHRAHNVFAAFDLRLLG